MTAPKKVLIYLFHRDLRTADQPGLQFARKEYPGAKIIPIFIFTPAQVTNNPYKSSNSVRFLIESLEDLHDDTDSKLSIYYGDTLSILEELFQVLSTNPKYNLVGLIETKDYTPFAIKRQQEVRGLCALSGIEFYQVEQTYLTEPGTVLNQQGRMFQKFTPFWESAQKYQVGQPILAPLKNIWVDGPKTAQSISLKKARDIFLDQEDLGEKVRQGGRICGLTLLSKLPDNYDTTHDLLAVETSRLSAHNHYGTVSIREVYWAAKDQMSGRTKKHLDGFIRQLYWRDFYGHICWAFQGLYGCSPYDFWTENDPDTTRRNKATAAIYKSQKVKDAFEKWTKGQTGAELVDAGMNQLLAEGFIHNRARLVCADYLVKELGVPWRWGEKWFAQHLVDYDFAQNFGNWCWVASVLPFSQAPFRRHNPETIQKRLDPDRIYTSKWSK
jgi:deoxyribodipyrimidine photo-lyase